jgi:hypothetical protein
MIGKTSTCCAGALAIRSIDPAVCGAMSQALRTALENFVLQTPRKAT